MSTTGRRKKILLLTAIACVFALLLDVVLPSVQMMVFDPSRTTHWKASSGRTKAGDRQFIPLSEELVVNPSMIRKRRRQAFVSVWKNYFVTNSKRQNQIRHLSHRLVEEACSETTHLCGYNGSACDDHDGRNYTYSEEPVHTERLRQLLLSGRRSLAAAVFGNSVAREHHFATTRLWMKAVEKVTGTQITMHHGKVMGGAELKDLLSCDGFVGEMKGAQLAILQYSSTEGPVLEKAVRRLLELSPPPVIVLISHCLMGDFSTREDWRHHPDRSAVGEPDGYYERIRAQEARIAQHYGLAHVQTCPAIFSMFNRTIGSADKNDLLAFRNVDDVIGTLIPDKVHLNELGSALQACFLAKLTLPLLPDGSAEDRSHKGKSSFRVPYLPKLVYPPGPNETDAMAVSKYCLSTMEQTLEPVSVRGWELVTGGGRGGRKSWYAAQSGIQNATLQFLIPSSDYLLMTVYTHHELPLGQVQVRVATKRAKGWMNILKQKKASSVGDDTELFFTIDPCCRASHCEGTGARRGIYRDFRLPTHGSFPKTMLLAEEFDISVMVVKRTEPSLCAKDGTDFSLVGIKGMSIT